MLDLAAVEHQMLLFRRNMQRDYGAVFRPVPSRGSVEFEGKFYTRRGGLVIIGVKVTPRDISVNLYAGPELIFTDKFTTNINDKRRLKKTIKDKYEN